MARLALVVGNGAFDAAAAFPRLRTPANDARDVAAVLRRHGGFETVATLIDATAAEMRHAVEDLYAHAERGDLTLLYYSGHGTKDRGGHHYLVARDTRAERLLSSGVKESFLREAMQHSASRHRVVILDCCFSGAFIEGRKAAVAEPLLLEQLRGEASAVMASSSAIQYSFEEQGRNSLFTRFLLEGIEEGGADEDEDDRIGLEELFAYADRRVREARPEQTPMLEHRARDSKIVLATNPKPRIRPAELAGDLREALASPNATARLGGVVRLTRMLETGSAAEALAARSALEPLADDDSREVSRAARAALAAAGAEAGAGSPGRGRVPGGARRVPEPLAEGGAERPAPGRGDDAGAGTRPATPSPPRPARGQRWLRRAASAVAIVLGANIVVIGLVDPFTTFGDTVFGLVLLGVGWAVWPRGRS